MSEASGSTRPSGEGLSFAKGLFCGLVQPARLHPFPRPSAEERELAELLLDSYRSFCAEQIDGARFDREHEVPASVRSALGEMGIMGLTVPEEHGGAGLGYTTYCRVMEETNRHCGSTAVVIGGHQSIGIKALLLHGTAEQKAAWLPKLASGEWIAAYALTEPQAGSDPAALETTADPVTGPDGVERFVLNGQKIWITNGGFANFITVFAKTPGAGGARVISCFVLTPAEMGQGFSRGAEEDKLGLRGSSTTQLFFDGLEVPAANLLGPPGKGLRVALEVLNYGRASLAAGCAGASKRVLEEAAKHAAARVQFGRPICEFEMIQTKLAEMAADTYATETIAYLTVGMADRGDADFSLEAAICKVFGTEAHWRTSNHAVQVAGGIAYVAEYPYERFLRDARINMIFEGTNEILRHFIALSGFREPGRALEAGGAADPAALLEHARGLAGFASASGPEAWNLHEALAAELPPLEALAASLGAAVHAALVEHGEALPEREFVQARLADAAIDLYVAFACLSRADARLGGGEGGAGAEDLEAELAVARKAIRDAAERVRLGLARQSGEDDALTGQVSGAVVGRAWPFPLHS